LRLAITTLVEVIFLPLWPITWISLAYTGDGLVTVVCYVEWRMVNKTVKCLEMAAVKEGNLTHVVDDINWRVSQIDCICQWQLVNHYLTIKNCLHVTVET